MLVANDQSNKMPAKEKVEEGERVTSSNLLKRSQSSREVWRGRRSSSEQCINLASRKEEEQDVCVQPGSLANMSNMDNLGTEAEGVGSFGFRLKRSLTVSHIIENFNKSFRVKRSQSQREVTPRKSKNRYTVPGTASDLSLFQTIWWWELPARERFLGLEMMNSKCVGL